jgi:hypothetical protein
MTFECCHVNDELRLQNHVNRIGWAGNAIFNCVRIVKPRTDDRVSYSFSSFQINEITNITKRFEVIIAGLGNGMNTFDTWWFGIPISYVLERTELQH